MISSAFFLLAFLLCLVSCLLIPKVKEAVSFIRSLVVCYLIVLCIGALIAFPLSLISVSINLISMGCVYLLLSFIIFFYIFRKKQIQKYYFDFFDLTAAILLFLFVLIVIWRVFSFNLKLMYYNSDTGIHFRNAMDIVRTGKLDLKHMYFSPLYNALFIELLEPIFSGIYAYKAFILADSFSNYIAGMMFYVLIASGCKSRKIQKLSPLITLIYFAGWPLYNYVLGGFVYWGMGATLFALGLYLLRLYQRHKDKRQYIMALLIIIICNITICYMLFVPYAIVLFLLLFIFLSWETIKKIDKRITIGVTVSVLTLCIAILLFAVFTFIHKSGESVFDVLSRDGGIHLSFYRDFIFFVPFVVYVAEKVRKTKTLQFNLLSLLIYLLMILGSLPLCFTGIMSPYYYYKLYYMLWLLLWLVTVDAISYILEEAHSWFWGYIVMLAFMFVYTFTPIEDYIIEKGLMIERYPEFPIYSANGSYVKSPIETRYTDGFWEFITFVTEDDTLDSIRLVGAPRDNIYLIWFEAISGYSCEYIGTSQNFEEYYIKSSPYNSTSPFAIIKSCEYYKEYVLELSKYSVIFENDFAIIYNIEK